MATFQAVSAHRDQLREVCRSLNKDSTKLSLYNCSSPDIQRYKNTHKDKYKDKQRFRPSCLSTIALRQTYKDGTQKAWTRNIYKIWEYTMKIMFPSTMCLKIEIWNRDWVIFQGRRNMVFAGNPAADQYIWIVNFPSSLSGKKAEI